MTSLEQVTLRIDNVPSGMNYSILAEPFKKERSAQRGVCLPALQRPRAHQDNLSDENDEEESLQ